MPDQGLHSTRHRDRSARTARGRRPERRSTQGLRVVGASVRESAARVRRGTSLRRFALGAGLVVVVVLVALWALWGSPWLRVKSVNVLGADADQQATVRRVADRELGQPLAKVDTSALQRDLGGVPAFSRVDVIRDWPDRLTVSVAVRTPVMAVAKSQGNLELVDSDGVTYARVNAAPQGVPEATLAHPDNAREVVSAARVLAALDPGQRARVSSVSAGSPDDVKFVIDGVTVLWGGPTEGRRKAVTMAALLQQKGVKSINVSAPDSPVMSK